MTDEEFDALRDEIGVWSDRRTYFDAGYAAGMKEAARLCDVNATAYGAMGATRLKEAARACAIVIRGYAETGAPHTSHVREGGGE